MTFRAVKLAPLGDIVTDDRVLEPIFAPLSAPPARQDGEDPPQNAKCEAALADLRRSVDALEMTIAALAGEREKLEARYRGEAAEFLIRVLEASAPMIGSVSAIDAVSRLLRASSRPAPTEAIQVRAHPTLIEEIERALAAAGRRPECELSADADMSVGAVAATWPGGGLSLDAASAVREITKALHAVLDRKAEHEISAE